MSEMSTLSLVLFILIPGLMFFHVSKLYLQKRWFFFDPLNMFWGGALVCYVLQPITYGNIFLAWHGEDVLEKTFFWILFGLTFVVIGYEQK
ncbi:MAG: hypothetical protein ACYDFU_04050, partial [Nitrospirota bacterium]